MKNKNKKTAPDYRAIVDTLREKGLTVTFAESCTGGLVSGALTEVPGASDIFPGAFVTYAAEVKQRFVGVAAETVRDEGVVSYRCAAEMAKGARKALHTDFAVSVTGVAGPGGGTAQTPVGLVFVGVSSKYGTRAYRLCFDGSRLSRRQIRQGAVYAAYRILKKEIDAYPKSCPKK